jgi:hypothetical protein
MEQLSEEYKEPAWYAIYTRSRHEAKIDGCLAKKGIVSFLPRMTVPSRRRDRHQMISVKCPWANKFKPKMELLAYKIAGPSRIFEPRGWHVQSLRKDKFLCKFLLSCLRKNNLAQRRGTSS